MKTSNIQISATGGPISINVSCPSFPQLIVGTVWRYNEDQSPDGKSGIFRTQMPDLPLGSPQTLSHKLFLVEGYVIHQADQIPSPYQIVVSLSQADKLLHQEVPAENGSGQLSDKTIGFLYRFSFKTL
jgi:hypothetical protein